MKPSIGTLRVANPVRQSRDMREYPNTHPLAIKPRFQTNRQLRCRLRDLLLRGHRSGDRDDAIDDVDAEGIHGTRTVTCTRS